jgi:hypothetical protein
MKILGQMKGNTFGTLYFARETLENTRSASLLRRSDQPKQIFCAAEGNHVRLGKWLLEPH